MMRAAFALILLVSPALAQEVHYDGQLLGSCLSGRLGEARAGCIGIAAARCMAEPDGDTTAGMVMCLDHEAKQWDAMLNADYEKLVATAKSNDDELKKLGSAVEPSLPALEEMQRSWISYRDATCAYEQALWQGGTGGGPAAVGCVMQLTAEQVLMLRDYLER